MFLKARFGPVAIVGARVPRIFTYENIQDTLHEMKQPGYFNDVKTVLVPNSRIEIIASDYHASIFVMGVVDGNICVYKNDIKCVRGEAIVEKAPEKQEKKKATVKAKKLKAA